MSINVKEIQVKSILTKTNVPIGDYAVNPFIGAFLGFLFLKEKLDLNYFIALIFMIFGTIFIIKDTLLKQHSHEHIHKINYKINGVVYTKEIIHSHTHNHYFNENIHRHKHM